MSDEPTSPSVESTDAFLPMMLVTLSVLLFFIWQISSTSEQRSATLNAQDQLESAFGAQSPQDAELIKQSQAIQIRLQKLIQAVLDLAKAGDPDAQAIVARHGIKWNPPAGTSATPAPTPGSEASPSPTN